MSYNYLSYANMPYWNVLPCGISNFGGDTQVFTLPDDITNGNIGMNLNEQALAVLNQQSNIYNNWGVTNPVTPTVPGMTTPGGTGNPFIDIMLNVANKWQANATQQRMGNVLSGINKLRQQLYGQLYKPGITEEEAAKINDYITKLNEQEQQLLQAAEDTKNGNMQISDLSQITAQAEAAVQNITGEIQIGQNIKACLKNMEKTFEKISNIEKRTDLTAPAKARLAELKSQLEKIKANLEKLQQNPDKLEPAKVNAELTKLCAEYNGILSAINQISATGVTQSTSPSQPSTPTDPSTPAEPSTPTTPSVPAQPSTPAPADNTPAPSSTPTPTSSTGYSAEGRAIVDQFDNGDLEEACKQINSGNVMDVMLAWQDLYATEHNQTFMERFVDKAGYSDKRTYGKLIMNALRDKVLELGLMDECREDFAKINREVKSIFWFDNDCAQNYDNIIKKIAEKEGLKYVDKPAK